MLARRTAEERGTGASGSRLQGSIAPWTGRQLLGLLQIRSAARQPTVRTALARRAADERGTSASGYRLQGRSG
ncbi:hypothetical protein, partial [Paenibacillus sp. HGF7]|uniref:hypothetical protein n=1 Tax=Paenibacillus sp. HGF7 TaxID=944559 RepID=UPI000564A89C